MPKQFEKNVYALTQNILKAIRHIYVYIYIDIYADKLIAKMFFMFSWHFGIFVHAMHSLLVFSSHC